MDGKPDVMTLLWLVLIIPGLIVAYVLFVRPVLKALPALKAFYAQADGFWAKVSALGGHSATIAWSYFMSVVGLAATGGLPASSPGPGRPPCRSGGVGVPPSGL